MESSFFNLTPVEDGVTTRSALRVWWLIRVRGFRIYRLQRSHVDHWLPWRRWVTEYTLLPQKKKEGA